MKKLILPLLAAFALGLFAVSAHAQAAISFDNQRHDFDFPNDITFQVEAKSDSDIEEATLVVRFADVTRRIHADITPGKDVTAEIVWGLESENSPAEGGYLPPGVTANYTWIVKDAAGNTAETQPRELFVEDNRIDWQTVENDDVAIHWYGADNSFGERIFEESISALDQLREELGAGTGGKVQIWFYTNNSDFETSMPDMNQWTGGRSFGQYRVIILHNSPYDVENAIRGARHELTHQVIYDSLGGGLARQAFPHWFNEGMAVYNESNDHDLAGFLAEPLHTAIATDSLPSLRSRGSAFPPDPNDALLSYGLAYSIVKLMFDEFGSAKVREVYKLFQNGVPADLAFRNVFGVDTDGLDNMFRESEGLDARAASGGIPTPKPIPTFALSSAETSVPSSSSNEPTRTPASVAVANTPASGVATTVPSASTSNESGGASTGLCGGVLGGFVLAMVGAYEWRKRRRPTQL